jgi:hypothetical protein
MKNRFIRCFTRTIRPITFTLMFLITTCTDIKKGLDVSGLEEIASSVERDFTPISENELTTFLETFSIDGELLPFPRESITVAPLHRWLLDDENIGDLVQERLSFPSCLRNPDGNADEAVFYLYRLREWKGSRVMLWIPGFGVSDFAFQFIRKFFRQALVHGYAVVFYNIPYHLERITPGKKSGEGFISSDIRKNLQLFRTALCEIRTVVRYLEDRSVAEFAGWGGSVGAAFLWFISSTMPVTHMTLMIPIVDWNTIMHHASFSHVLDLYAESGLKPDTIRYAYNMISPIDRPSLTDPSRILLLYARYDQLTPESKILDFTFQEKISHVHAYDESHASILLNEKLYRDYAEFLDQAEVEK